MTSQRIELLGQLVAAQFDLESAIAEINRSGTSAAPAQSQLQMLAQLQRQVGTADPTALTAMHNTVAGVIAQTQAIAQQGRTAANGAEMAEAVTLNSLAAASRAQVASLMRDMHRLDPYLRFDSPENEAEYRRREVERRERAEAELRKNTPEGNLNAAGAMVGQMADAKAHGAGDSPEFQQRWDELVATTDKLDAAMRAQGRSTKEFDQHLRDDLRRIMKSKGLSDAEIDQRFADNPNPLEAAKAYVGTNDVQTLAQTVAITSDVSPPTPTIIVASDEPLPNLSVDQAMANLRAAGISVAEQKAGPFAHGVTVQDQPANGRPSQAVRN